MTTAVPLGPGPVIIPLDAWTQDSISAIYQAKTASEFSSAFDAFIHEEANITVNGKRLSRVQYKALFQDERLLEQSAKVSFLGSVEVPANKDEPVAAGSVGIFYKVVIDEKIKVLGADRSTTVNSSLNVVIRDGDDIEDRFVTRVDQVITDTVNPTIFPRPLDSTKA